ncbi:hypothetical protein [Olivibacter ginsenosidimutans]|uniref:hypothetical protein n=1 Tax=Olivibacter ginsenosidimutans TaxID=1176537 RepID=UPI0031E6D812
MLPEASVHTPSGALKVADSGDPLAEPAVPVPANTVTVPVALALRIRWSVDTASRLPSDISHILVNCPKPLAKVLLVPVGVTLVICPLP